MAKYWPNSSFKILPQLQLQNPYQTLCSKSEQKLSFMTKPQLQQQTSVTSETVTTSTSFDLVSSHTRVTSIKCTKREWVSDKGSHWSDSGPIKKWLYVVFNDSNQIGNFNLTILVATLRIPNLFSVQYYDITYNVRFKHLAYICITSSTIKWPYTAHRAVVRSVSSL